MEQVVGILKFGKKDKITMRSGTFFLLFYIDNFFENVYTQKKSKLCDSQRDPQRDSQRCSYLSLLSLP
jgi:hypothetical protein